MQKVHRSLTKGYSQSHRWILILIARPCFDVYGLIMCASPVFLVNHCLISQKIQSDRHAANQSLLSSVALSKMTGITLMVHNKSLKIISKMLASFANACHTFCPKWLRI